MAPPAPSNRCLYEILGVSRDCSAEDIRAAYKKQALRLHPDKVAQSAGGATDDAEATAAFQELQVAYDVLRDPKERAWYDAHRSQILFASNRGSAPGNASNPNPAGDGFFSSFFSKFTSSYGGRATGRAFNSPVEDLGNLYAFFSPSAFSGFSDTGRGFYKVYGDLFNKIYSNEVRFAEEVLGRDPVDALEPAPLMGNLDSPYEQWTAFYSHWLGFSTLIDFAWADMYDAREAINRKVRREMEELNKKVRRRMRKEYNDTVRSLAAFVKKRDKRVVEMLMRKKAEEEERREELRKKKEEEKKKKEDKARQYREAIWAQIDDEVDEEILYDAWYGAETDDKKKAANGGEELYCVVCSKKFKSDKQWKNHEQSKKHRDKVAELKESLQGEDDALDGTIDDVEEEGVHASFDYVQEPSEDSDDGVVDGLCEDFEDGFGFQEQAAGDGISKSGVGGLGSEDEVRVLEAMVSSHKSRKAVYVEQPCLSPSNVSHHDVEVGCSMEYDIGKKGRKNRRAKKGNHSTPGADDVQAKDTPENSGFDEGRRDEDNADQMKESSSCSFDVADSRLRGGRKFGKNLKQKKQQFDGNFAVNKDTDAATKSSSKGKKQKGTSKAPSNACGTCGESFDSRNKLFVHLGDTGHAVLKLR